MENVKKLLKDFKSYYDEQKRFPIMEVGFVEDFLKGKSLNDFGLIETKAVGQNKFPKKDCDLCGGAGFYYETSGGFTKSYDCGCKTIRLETSP